MTDKNSAAYHKTKMEKKKAARDKIMAGKTETHGLVIVHTGNGKGKSTAAWGLALRAMGHGKRVGIVQFVKGAWETGERHIFEDRFSDLCTIKALGRGFSWESQDLEADTQAAADAWAAALDLLGDGKTDVIILDEVNIALRYEQLAVDAVIEGLGHRHPGQHVVLTGRGAPQALVEVADLVTDMTLVKHPFRSGVKAQEGVEF